MTNEKPRPEFTTPLKDAYAHYEGGKNRRYNLLFSVNGGAFAIAQLLTKPENKMQVLGNLTLTHLAIGMIAFTAIMVYDIFKFGDGMRLYLGNKVFAEAGRIVLFAIGLLIVLGWGMVAFGPAIIFTK
jgi:hypothetical protein